MKNPENGRTIVVRETPEMANWMHPQTEERKELIRKQTEEAKKRLSRINRKPALRHAVAQAARKGIYPTVEIRVGSRQVLVTRIGELDTLKKATLNRKIKIRKNVSMMSSTTPNKTN